MFNNSEFPYRSKITSTSHNYLKYGKDALLRTICPNDPYAYIVLAIRAINEEPMNTYEMCQFLGLFLIHFHDCIEGKKIARVAAEMIIDTIKAVQEPELSVDALYKLAEIQLLLRVTAPQAKVVFDEKSKKEKIDNPELRVFYASLSTFLLLRQTATVLQNQIIKLILDRFRTPEIYKLIFNRFILLFKTSLEAYYNLRSMKNSSWTQSLVNTVSSRSKSDFQNISADLSPAELEKLEQYDIDTFTRYITSGCAKYPIKTHARLGELFADAQKNCENFKVIFPDARNTLSITGMERSAAFTRSTNLNT